MLNALMIISLLLKRWSTFLNLAQFSIAPVILPLIPNFEKKNLFKNSFGAPTYTADKAPKKNEKEEIRVLREKMPSNCNATNLSFSLIFSSF